MKNEPAFPGVIIGSKERKTRGLQGEVNTVRESILSTGLTKRELFAAMAMQGFMANEKRTNAYDMNTSFYAKKSVEVADALIKELNTGE